MERVPTMKAWLMYVLAASVSLGCHASIVFGGGDEPAVDGGADPVVDAGTEPDVPRPFVFEGTVEDREGRPLDGVNVALDPLGRGRLEATTDALGAFRIEGPAGPETFDGVVALEGFRIFAFDGFDPADLAELSRAPLVLTPLETPGERVPVLVRATGVPSGGRWCLGLARLQLRCLGVESTGPLSIEARRVAEWPDYVHAFAFDAEGELVDFVRGAWVTSEEGLEATVAFDGRFEEAPEAVERVIELPDDPGSPFRTEELDDAVSGSLGPTWLYTAEAGTGLMTSVITDLVVEATQVTVRLLVFPGLEDEALVWWLAPFAVSSESGAPLVYSVRSFTTRPPAESLGLLDVPRVTRARRWDEEVTWTAPAPDVDLYEVQYRLGERVVSISLLTRDTAATMPPLPSGYDRSVSFPVRGASGNARAIAVRGDVPLSLLWPRNLSGEIRGDAAWSVGPPSGLSW